MAPLVEELAPLAQRLRSRRRELHAGRSYLTGRLGGREVVVGVAGEGPQVAAQGLAGLLASFDVEVLLVVGTAGGLTPGLPAGTIVLAREVGDAGGPAPPPDAFWLARAGERTGAVVGRVLSVSAIARDAAEKAEIRRTLGRGGNEVVDLESAALARVAARHAIPYLVARAVSDPADEALPLDFEAFRGPDGRLRRKAIVAHALFHPGTLRPLLRLRRRVRSCASALAELVVEVLAS